MNNILSEKEYQRYIISELTKAEKTELFFVLDSI